MGGTVAHTPRLHRTEWLPRVTRGEAIIASA